MFYLNKIVKNLFLNDKNIINNFNHKTNTDDNDCRNLLIYYISYILLSHIYAITNHL